MTWVMSLYDSDDPEEYVRIQHEVANQLPRPVSLDDVRQILALRTHPTGNDEEIERLLKRMGYREQAAGQWQPEVIAIIGTGDRDSIRDGGGVVLYEPEHEQFRWAFWKAPDDEDDPDAVWTMRWVTFRTDETQADLLASVGAHNLERAGLLDAAEAQALAASEDLLDQLDLLEVIAQYDVDYLDDAPAEWTREDMVTEFGFFTDVVAGRTRDQAQAVLDGLGLAGGAVPAASGPSPVDAALAAINARRRQLMMPPLDPAASGWSDEDVLLEAQRLQSNPSSSPRDLLLAWNPR